MQLSNYVHTNTKNLSESASWVYIFYSIQIPWETGIGWLQYGTVIAI